MWMEDYFFLLDLRIVCFENVALFAPVAVVVVVVLPILVVPQFETPLNRNIGKALISFLQDYSNLVLVLIGENVMMPVIKYRMKLNNPLGKL
jgi:hypothetical protein